MMRARVLTIGGVAIAYIVSGVAVRWSGIHDDTLLLWPPTGIALATTLLCGLWIWPGVVLGAFATVLLSGHPLVAACWISVVDGLEVLIAGALLRRARFAGLERVRDVLALGSVAFVVSALGAAASVSGLHAVGYVPAHRQEALFASWWWSHASSILVLVPLILTWRTRRTRSDMIEQPSVLETALLALAILIAGIAVFARWLPVWLPDSFSPHYLLPMLLWAAIRFGSRGAATAIFAVSITAVASMSFGGPIENALELHTFISVSTVATLLLSASMAERVHAVMRRSAFERAALDAILTIDRDFRIAELNPAAEQMFGWPARQALGADVTQLLSPPKLQALHQAVLRRIRDERRNTFVGHRVETYLRRADGSELPVEVALTNVPFDDERMLTAMIHDVSAARAAADAHRQAFDALEDVVEARTVALVKMNEELQRRGALLRHAERLAQLGSFELDLSTGTCEWSDELYDIFGVDPATFTPSLQNFLAAVHPADRAQVQMNIEHVTESGGVCGMEVRIVRPDGDVRSVRMRGDVLCEAGRQGLMSGCCQDITEHKAAEEARYRLANIAAFSEDAIISLRPDGVIETWNAGATRLFGYTETEMAGQPCVVLVDESQRERLQDIVSRVCAGEHVAHFEMRHRRRDGSTFEASVTTSAIRDASGTVIGVSKVMRDISARKLFEDQMRVSLYEKEVLLREIHHRVKNNLQIISSLLNLQLSRQISDHARRGLVESQSRIQSMALVHQLLCQSKDLNRIDLRSYLHTLTRTLLATYHVGAAQIEVSVEGPAIHLDIDKAVPCGLIINELVANALDHAFAGRERGAISVTLSRQGPHRIAIVVADDGVGVPEHVLTDPAHTFGLRIARTLATQLGGTLELLSAAGTTLSLEFPVTIRRGASGPSVASAAQ